MAMQDRKMMVFTEMRPPVAAQEGNSPLRGKHVNKLFDLAASEYQDNSGFRLTKDQLLKNFTDDARLTDKQWNNRHHVTPSAFNYTNHKYYKVSSPMRNFANPTCLTYSTAIL